MMSRAQNGFKTFDPKHLHSFDIDILSDMNIKPALFETSAHRQRRRLSKLVGESVNMQQTTAALLSSVVTFPGDEGRKRLDRGQLY